MKLFYKIRSLSRGAKLAVTAVVLTAVVAVPFAVNAEFFPNRPTFDYSKYNGNDNCNDASNIATQNGRCGSLTGPVFNSFINTPSYGDERAFFDGRRTDQTVGQNADDITDVNKTTKEVVLRTYVHNNANQNTNNTVGIAKNTKVRIALPTATEQVLRARSYISADNAAMVEDTADLLGTEKFKVEYIPGSAKLLRGTASYNLNDSIVTTGAPVGDKAMNGELPGCFEFAALVEIRVKVIVQQNPDLQLVKEVKVKGATGWNKEISTKPNTLIQWRLSTKNISNVTLNQVNVRDALPAHLSVVPGSVRLIDANQDTVQNDAPLFGGGLGLGTYPSAGIRYIIFDSTVKDDFKECEVRLRNYAYANSKETPVEDQDSAVVNVKKENCIPNVVKPVYTCDSLKAVKTGGFGVAFTASATAKDGAVIKQYNYTFGDGQSQTSASNTINHTYATNGTYTAKVSVDFTVNGQTVSNTGPQCEVVVKFDKPDEKKPEFACDSLKAEKLGGRKVKFTASATAKDGAVVKQYIYNFGDATTETSTKNVVEHTYDKDGKFTAILTVEFTVNGQTESATSPECKVKIEFENPEEPKKPEFTCDLLTAEKTGGRSVKFTVKATAKNGAEIKRYIYSFGDGGEQTTDKNEVSHTYAKDGKYVARVQVQFSVGNETKTVEDDKCAVQVEFTTTPTPETPGKLPETGAGSTIAIFMAVASASSIGYYTLVRRS